MGKTQHNEPHPRQPNHMVTTVLYRRRVCSLFLVVPFLQLRSDCHIVLAENSAVVSLVHDVEVILEVSTIVVVQPFLDAFFLLLLGAT